MLGSWKYLRSKMGGGGMVSLIWNTLIYIGGTRPEALFCGRLDKQLLRVNDRSIFLDVNTDFLRAVVDSLNKQKYHIS